MALSVRIFGLSSWSLLVPQALEGVAAVGLLYATVRRTTGSTAAGLLAGVVLATTPVAVLMFRFDNPDALLTLLLVGSAYAALRAVESTADRHPVRWLALAGALVGLGVPHQDAAGVPGVPALGLVYLLFAHTSLLKRLGHLLVGLGAMVASAGWWVAIVSLWPASSRPYIGGSQDNSILELTLGYNGFGRLTGNEVGSVGGGGGERRHVGRDRPGPAAERRDRRPDRLAAADRAAAARRRAVVHPRGPRAPTASGRAWCSGAGGWSSPRRRSASWPGSSTPTTRWRWPPRSAPWSAPAPGCSGSTAPRCSPRAWPARRCRSRPC